MSSREYVQLRLICCFFFFNDTATTEIYTLSLHDAFRSRRRSARPDLYPRAAWSAPATRPRGRDRKSTRLNSSHSQISYAVFCLKKKKDDTLAEIRSARVTRRHGTICQSFCRARSVSALT